MTEKSRRKSPLVAEKRYASGARTASGKAKRKPAKPKSRSAAKKRLPAKSTARRRPPARRGSKRGRSGGGGIGGWFLRLLLGLIGWIFRVIWAIVWRSAMVASVLIGAAVAYTYTTLPELNTLLDARARGSVTLLDRKGEVFAWRGDQFGGVVTVATVSPYLRDAILATEDRRFYQHFGVSPRGVASAVRINLNAGRGPLSGNGGSTITQQTAKLLCLGEPFDPTSGQSEAQYEAGCRKTTLGRKAREAIYALAMEVKYSKDDILAIYMNRTFLGAGARGFEAASQRYFGKSAALVNPAEAAMLAGLLKAPTRYAPTNNLSRSQDRANVIVGLMQEQGFLTAEQAQQARDNPARLSAAAAAEAGGYFADWVMEKAPDYFARNTTEDVIIQTTLDQRIQTSAEEAMQLVFQEKVDADSKMQAAIVVMSADGAVRAMVGGRKTRVAGVFNRATQAKRQTGSAFKPFVYATALDLGYSPLDLVVDEPFCMNIAGSGEWCPKNYTGKNYGEITFARALRDSLNIPAVKVSEMVGRENVRSVASGFGIQSDLAAGPALALGASDSTLIEMTGAFAGILNGGSSVTPYGLVELRLQGDPEPLMGATGGIGERVIQTSAAEQLIWMMEKVVAEGTGKRAKLPDRQVAGKTGTTQGLRDAWFVGFTANYVVGVWMGNDDNTPLKRVTGGGLPATIWFETMIRVTEGTEPVPLPMREPVAPVQQPEPPQSPAKSTGLGGAVDQLLRGIFGSKPDR
jgi:1A family penicillin-binding protein